MKISEKLERIINQQIANEFQSAYIYLGMAAYYEGTPYKGFAKWMRLQAKEETEHAEKFFNYLASRGGKIELHAIEKVATEFENVVEPFQKAYEHEMRVTGWIHDIYELAVLEKDYETQEFLNYFVREQIEEEEQTLDFLEKLQMSLSHPTALISLDAVAESRAE